MDRRHMTEAGSHPTYHCENHPSSSHLSQPHICKTAHSLWHFAALCRHVGKFFIHPRLVYSQTLRLVKTPISRFERNHVRFRHFSWDSRNFLPTSCSVDQSRHLHSRLDHQPCTLLPRLCSRSSTRMVHHTQVPRTRL